MRNSYYTRDEEITFNGRTMLMSKWADELGMTLRSLIQRLDNWSLERALTTPNQHPRKKK